MKILFSFFLFSTLALCENIYNEEARTLYIKPDGKIVISGYVFDGDSSTINLFRILPDGGYDSGFGSSGKVTQNLPGQKTIGDNVIVYPDGKIVSASQFDSGGQTQLSILRFLDNGNIDASFGKEGQALLPIKSTINEGQAMVVQPDGKIVLAGFQKADKINDLSISRLLPDGNYDATFGTKGKTSTRISGVDDRFFGNAIQTDSKVIAVGQYTRNNIPQMLITRFNKNGTLDPSFGTGGGVFPDWGGFPSVARGVAVQRDKKIMVVGEFTQNKNGFIAVARLKENGSLDNTFGNQGRIAIDIGPGDDRAVAVAIQADGKAVVLADSDNGTSRDFVIIRLLDNGALDPKFADQGKRILKVRDNAYTERGFKPWNVKNFQLGGLFVIQSPGGSSFSGTAAWTPLYRLNEKFGIKANIGALLLKKITGENFLGVDYSLGFQWKPVRYFSFEEALGAQTWLDYGGTSFALSAQINWYMSDHLKVKKPFFQKLLDRVFFGYSLLTDAVFIHQLKLGIGVDF